MKLNTVGKEPSRMAAKEWIVIKFCICFLRRLMRLLNYKDALMKQLKEIFPHIILFSDCFLGCSQKQS